MSPATEMPILNKNSNNARIITVNHEFLDGWHTFTSPHVPGLFLSGKHEDLRELYDDLPGVIGELAQADFGMAVTVTPEHSYETYFDTLPSSHIPPSHFTVRPAA